MKTARDIVRALGGRWNGRAGIARCPAHDDRAPSLSVSQTRDGRPLVHCFAGCDGRTVIAALRARGLWQGDAIKDPSYLLGVTYRHDGHDDRDERERSEAARRLWDRATPAHGTLVQVYLRARGIRVTIPYDLRFFPRLEHAPSKKCWPAMIAALRDDRDQVIAIQRTYLAIDGTAKAPIEGAKRTLGPMRSSAVRLGPSLEILGLAEGIETALSAGQIYGFPVWATLSASRLGKIALPAIVKRLTIFADRGNAGMISALDAAEIYEHRGLVVDVMPPRVHFGENVKDFNDAVRATA